MSFGVQAMDTSSGPVTTNSVQSWLTGDNPFNSLSFQQQCTQNNAANSNILGGPPSFNLGSFFTPTYQSNQNNATNSNILGGPPSFNLGSFFTPTYQPNQIPSYQSYPQTMPQERFENIKNHFTKMNTCNGHFSEVFHYLLTMAPDATKAFNPIKHVRVLEGSTRFDYKHEQNFINQIETYNNLQTGRFKVGYKKNAGLSNMYTVAYDLQIVSKN